MNYEAVLEGLLFVVGDDGLSLNQISDILDIDIDKSKELVMNLRKTYESDNRGITINF